MQFNFDPKQFALDWLSGDAYIPVNKYTAHKIGPLEALLLSETLGQYKRWARMGKLNEHDEFYWTVEDCLEQTALSRDRQQSIFNKLEKHKLLKRTMRQIKEGEPKTARFIKIHFDNIPAILFDDPSDSALRQEKMKARKAKIKLWNAKRKLRDSDSGKSAILTAPTDGGNSSIGDSGNSSNGDSGNSSASNKESFNKKDFNNDLYKPQADKLSLIDLNNEEYQQIMGEQQDQIPNRPPFYNWIED